MKRTRAQAGFTKQRNFKRPRVNPNRTLARTQVIPRLPSPERKVQDIAPTIYGMSTTGVVTPIFFPQLGTDFTNRVGRKVVVKSIQSRGIVRVTAAETGANATVGPQMTRITFLVDNQPNAAVAAITDIFATAHPASPLNLNNRDRFKVLWDEQFYLDAYGRDTTGTPFWNTFNKTADIFKMYRKCNIETIFNATNGGSIADITSGALLMVTLGNQPIGAAAPAQATIQTRVRFVDA